MEWAHRGFAPTSVASVRLSCLALTLRTRTHRLGGKFMPPAYLTQHEMSFGNRCAGGIYNVTAVRRLEGEPSKC